MTSVMYDSTNPRGIPPGAADLLVYTDGAYANQAEMRAMFPAARIHTISVLGQVRAEWIDVEVGCVWPPTMAVPLWRLWQLGGCKGFYCARSTRTILAGLLTAAEAAKVEWFEADPTGVAHVLPGDVATQYLWAAGFDASETTPAFEGTPTPPPAPAPTPVTQLIHGGNMLAYDPQTGGTWGLRPDGSVYAADGAEYLGGLNTHPEWNAGGGKANGPAVGIAPFGPGGEGGYEIMCDNGVASQPARYRFPRDGSLKG